MPGSSLPNNTHSIKNYRSTGVTFIEPKTWLKAQKEDTKLVYFIYLSTKTLAKRISKTTSTSDKALLEAVIVHFQQRKVPHPISMGADVTDKTFALIQSIREEYASIDKHSYPDLEDSILKLNEIADPNTRHARYDVLAHRIEHWRWHFYSKFENVELARVHLHRMAKKIYELSEYYNPRSGALSESSIAEDIAQLQKTMRTIYNYNEISRTIKKDSHSTTSTTHAESLYRPLPEKLLVDISKVSEVKVCDLICDAEEDMARSRNWPQFPSLAPLLECFIKDKNNKSAYLKLLNRRIEAWKKFYHGQIGVKERYAGLKKLTGYISENSKASDIDDVKQRILALSVGQIPDALSDNNLPASSLVKEIRGSLGISRPKYEATSDFTELQHYYKLNPEQKDQNVAQVKLVLPQLKKLANQEKKLARKSPNKSAPTSDELSSLKRVIQKIHEGEMPDNPSCSGDTARLVHEARCRMAIALSEGFLNLEGLHKLNTCNTKSELKQKKALLKAHIAAWFEYHHKKGMRYVMAYAHMITLIDDLYKIRKKELVDKKGKNPISVMSKILIDAIEKIYNDDVPAYCYDALNDPKNKIAQQINLARYELLNEFPPLEGREVFSNLTDKKSKNKQIKSLLKHFRLWKSLHKKNYSDSIEVVYSLLVKLTKHAYQLSLKSGSSESLQVTEEAIRNLYAGKFLDNYPAIMKVGPDTFSLIDDCCTQIKSLQKKQFDSFGATLAYTEERPGRAAIRGLSDDVSPYLPLIGRLMPKLKRFKYNGVKIDGDVYQLIRDLQHEGIGNELKTLRRDINKHLGYHAVVDNRLKLKILINALTELFFNYMRQAEVHYDSIPEEKVAERERIKNLYDNKLKRLKKRIKKLSERYDIPTQILNKSRHEEAVNQSIKMTGDYQRLSEHIEKTNKVLENSPFKYRRGYMSPRPSVAKQKMRRIKEYIKNGGLKAALTVGAGEGGVTAFFMSLFFGLPLLLGVLAFGYLAFICNVLLLTNDTRNTIAQFVFGRLYKDSDDNRVGPVKRTLISIAFAFAAGSGAGYGFLSMDANSMIMLRFAKVGTALIALLGIGLFAGVFPILGLVMAGIIALATVVTVTALYHIALRNKIIANAHVALWNYFKRNFFDPLRFKGRKFRRSIEVVLNGLFLVVTAGLVALASSAMASLFHNEMIKDKTFLLFSKLVHWGHLGTQIAAYVIADGFATATATVFNSIKVPLLVHQVIKGIKNILHSTYNAVVHPQKTGRSLRQWVKSWPIFNLARRNNFIAIRQMATKAASIGATVAVIDNGIGQGMASLVGESTAQSYAAQSVSGAGSKTMLGAHIVESESFSGQSLASGYDAAQAEVRSKKADGQSPLDRKTAGLAAAGSVIMVAAQSQLSSTNQPLPTELPEQKSSEWFSSGFSLFAKLQKNASSQSESLTKNLFTETGAGLFKPVKQAPIVDSLVEDDTHNDIMNPGKIF